MNISILSVFPELYEQFLKTSLIARAQEKKHIVIDCDSFFSFVAPKERIDAPTYGPGAGMLIRPEVIQKALEAKEQSYGPAFKIFFSPQGKKVDQCVLGQLADIFMNQKHLMVVAGRYEGMDARVEERYADMILSIGDFVLMGGDIPAMIVLEGMLRLVPEIVGKKESIERESFVGPFVDYPEYTEPLIWEGMEVPEIVRSGNHAAIEKWRKEKAAEKTVLEHFDWLRSYPMSSEDKNLAEYYIPPHYAALLHSEVLLPDERVGTTSVTSIDIHDGARSAKTYGLKNYFIVTPLEDQQKIVKTLLDFWQKGVGKEYNLSRYHAIKSVELMSSLHDVKTAIEEREGQKPLLIATSARPGDHKHMVNYFDQSLVWEQKRPVLLIFGTGKGLSEDILSECDYLLMPIEGFSDFNHLSVRSAMAIVFDRWLGVNLKH
jgi:tRNA (guanine37-N1)-methyltransferase